MRFLLLVFIWTLTLLSAPSISQSAVTVFKDYVFENPPAVVLPRLIRQKGCRPEPADNEWRILVFGDSGTGDENQMKVAAAMQKFCEKHGCDLALVLGDNIHPQGVRSVDDPQFINKFEKPYEGLCIPFYVILGEHDWGRKDEMYNWKAQIEYSQRSSRWRMPSDVYSLTIGDLKILALNTNVLDSSQAQLDWLKKELENSQARWNLVMGHKPIHSYGYHGDTDFMTALVLPHLCGRADLYLSGHDHNLQVLKADCGLPLLISAAAGKLRPEKETGPRSLFAAPELGFAYLQVRENVILVQVVSTEGEILYSFSVPEQKRSDLKGTGKP
jgi:tartrate-resistant acid phosphatase type 5